MLTITEALADIKTSQARIAKKREAIMRYLARDSRLRDPMEAEGGSKEWVRRERQSIFDLEEKIVRLRSQIQAVNLATKVAVEGRNRTISEWLNWRREVSGPNKTFLGQMAAHLTSVRANALRQGQAVSATDTGNPAGDVIVSLSEQELAQEVEQMETVLGQLDGKLSLLNATVTIEG